VSPRRAAALLVLLLPGSAFAEDARPSGTRGRSKQRLQQVERRIHQTESEAKSIAAKATGVLGQIESLDREIDRRESRVRTLGEEIRAEEGKRDSAQKKAAALDADLVRLRAELVARSRGLYRLTRRGVSAVVFQARGDLTESLRNRRALESIVEHDRALLAGIRRNRTEAEAARRTAAEAAAALAPRRAEARQELDGARGERKRKQELLASLRTEGARRSALLEELRGSAGKLRALLEREEAAPPTSPPIPPMARGTKLRSPIPGLAAAREVSVVRTGVEIAAPEGTPIESVAGGRVVFADWLSGYGKLVIVDHGSRLYSVYAYASELLAKRGDVVSAGDAVAKVGSTGAASRPSLYFEIRDRGSARDPRSYVPALAPMRGAIAR
jgi:septal ring factor EnvC (AmiA/AmiB activator)